MAQVFISYSSKDKVVERNATAVSGRRVFDPDGDYSALPALRASSFVPARRLN